MAALEVGFGKAEITPAPGTVKPGGRTELIGTSILDAPFTREASRLAPEAGELLAHPAVRLIHGGRNGAGGDRGSL